MQNLTGKIDSLERLRKIAGLCSLLHFFASFFYLFCSFVFPQSNEMAVSCGILAIFISLTPIFYAISTRRFPLAFSCISVFNLAPIWFLYLEGVLPGYDAYSFTLPQYRMEGFVWISIFLFFVNFLYGAFWKRGSRFSIKSFSFLDEIKLKPKFFIRLSIASFLLPLIAFYYFYGSAETLWLALTGGRAGGGGDGLLIRGSEGDTGSLMLPFVWLWQLTPLLGSIAFISAKGKDRFFSVLSLTMGLFVIFVFFLGGTRSAMISVAAPVLFFLFYYNWNRGLKFWITAASLFFILIAVMEIQVRFRGNLLDVIANPTKAAKDQGLDSITTFDPTKTQRDNNLYLFCLMIKRHPDKYPFEGFNDFFAILSNPIPRAIWAGKPLLRGAKDMSYQQLFVLDGPLEMGTTSLTYSVVGEAYLAQGLFGIMIYSIIYALFLLYFDGIINHTRKKQPLSVGILGVGVFLAFWGFRSLFALVTFLYPIILLILIIRLIAIIQSSNGKERVPVMIKS